MIPVRLTLRNFMCYRGNIPTLNFESIHVACLSGDNGSGKSTLIDAITWALWGKARSNSDDDLIHAAETEMAVEFDLAVKEQVYRIIRKRSRPKKRTGAGQSILEFQIATDNGFHAISGNTIAQTQQKIIETLHMDYKTFINSAYLRQGHADEFTTQDPAKRKEVLSNILGLSIYDELEDRAREIVKQRDMEKSQIESLISDINDELGKKPAYEAELENAQEELARIEDSVKEKDSALIELRQKKEVFDYKQVQLNEFETRLQHFTKDLARWKEQAGQHRTRLAAYEQVISQRQTIEEGYALFVASKKENELLDQKFRHSVNLEKTKTQLESRINEAKQQIIREHAVIQHEINNLEGRVQELSEIKNHLSQAQQQAQQLSEAELALTQREQNDRKLQARVTQLEAEIKQLEAEIKGLTEKIDLISSQKEPKCPLCETELAIEGLKLIESKYLQEKQEKTRLLTTRNTNLKQAQTDLEQQRRETARQQTSLNREKTQVQSQLTVLLKKISEIESDNEKLAAAKLSIGEIEQRLAQRDFAITEQKALEQIEAELTAIGYEPVAHEQIQQKFKQLEHFEQEQRKLEEAEKLINQEKNSAAAAEQTIEGLKNNIKKDGERKAVLTAELAGFPQIKDDLARTEAEHQSISALRSQAQEALGSTKAKLQRCTELEARKKDREVKLAQVLKEASIYRELAKAFGKSGIQVLLIEQAIPDIENEANQLLSRLTDGRLTVKFDTQKDTKKGTVQETLDINIDDGMGTRKYEMFSGGEAFRIDFAIRIALSRLLTRRAGAPLPTLIIDEGFGTQDTSGIEKLKEAINSIQDDFDKILVITHIDELRDAFPVRIDVTKTPEGSTITVN